LPIWSKLYQPKQTKFGAYKFFTDGAIPGHNKVTDFFYSFWCDLSKNGHKPSRADIQPVNLKKYLNRVILLDVTGDGPDIQLTVRLIGTHVAAFYGELSGQDINAMENKPAAARIYNICRQVLQQDKPILTVTTGISSDKTHLEAYSLYMPLYDTAGKPHKIIASADILPIA